ncbi:DUF6301 family protein [Microbacterium sp.]|uniref:DUF6301 family protein n=1 Tax=Microbacterium sp. TaxID=51671 RepID=UPI003F9D922F
MKVMPPAEVFDVLDFAIGLDWPLSRDEVQKLAAERFGWTIETEDGKNYLVNTVAALTHSDVRTIDVKGQVYSSNFRVTDTTPPPTPESTAFLSDQFALLVREGVRRWGKQTMNHGQDATRASWHVPGDGRVSFSLLERSVSAFFRTPQGVESDRKAAFYGV